MPRRTARLRHVPSCLLLALVGACAVPEVPPAPAVRIACTRTAADNLVVPATLNGSDRVALMLHTAVDSVSLTTAAIARLAHFHASATIPVQSWGGTTKARYSTGNTLQIGGLAFADIAITECLESGPGSDGKFGPNLFGERIVEIDADAGAIVLHTQLPPLAARCTRLDLVRRGGSLFVRGEIGVGDGTVPVEFLLHTGFGGTVLLDTAFVRDHGLTDRLPIVAERELRDSFGHPVKTRTVRVPQLRLGALVFSDVPAGLFEGAIGGQRTNVIGGSVLWRCHLILDAAHGHVYLAPGPRFAAPFQG